MPRNPDMPCADCGKLLWRGSTSLPAGLARCQPCRRKVPRSKGAPRKAPCPACGVGFARKDAATCSRVCGQRLRSEHCLDCGAPTLTQSLRCSVCAPLARRDLNRRKNSKRRGINSANRPARLAEVAIRDGGRCHLCRKLVNLSLKAPDRRSPTLDHLIPVADGGSDESENLRLAHFGCNSRRGTRGTVQLLLFG